MRTVEELLSIPVNENKAAADAAARQWDGIAKPLGSLGLLEEDIVRIAALTGNADVRLQKRALLVFCADHGVTAKGVTQCGSEVTAKVAAALARGMSTVNPMARIANCEVIPVDMGILDFSPIPGVISRRVGNGTADLSEGPAMTRGQCRQAIAAGADLVREMAEEGFRIVAVGEMGIANTTSAAAVAACLLHLAPEDVTGRGAGLSDEGLKRKREAVRSALQVNRPDAEDVLDVLAKVGGFELAGMCGAFLGAGNEKIPVIIDGMISAVAALCAMHMKPTARAAFLASHVSSEPAGKILLDALGLQAPLHAGMHLGEGSGAVCLLPLLDQALAVYHSGQNFEKLGIEAYTPQNGKNADIDDRGSFQRKKPVC